MTTTTQTRQSIKTAAIAAFLSASFLSAAPAFAMPAGNALANTRQEQSSLARFASNGEIIKATETKGSSTEKINEGAENFIKSMAQQALDFLGDGNLSQEKKKDQFRNLLQKSFDMNTIGRFSLGRYWRVSTPQQRKEYLSLFNDMVIDVYSSRFGDYKGQHFETRSYRADGEKDTIVTSFIVSDNGPEVQVDWRVRYKDGHYKIVDVIVEGVSMSVTQRSDFSAVIQRGGGDVQVLLDHLKKQQSSTL